MAVTGPLAPNGKQALLGAKIWEEEINAKGGLLGRKVELVNYDDQSKPENIPGIYTKLLEVDKVDIVMGPYGTNLNAPAMPVVMQKGKLFIGFFALDINSEFQYPKYFSMLPTGPKPREAFTEGFFQVAAEQNPKPQTVALSSEDAEFARNACDGARNNAKTYGFKIIYDKTFPPGTTDFSPIIRAFAGRQCGPRGVLFLSAELGRHGAVGERARAQAEDARRRDGRIAGDRVQGPAQVQAQRHRQLRNLGAVAKADGAGKGVLREIPGARQGRRCRSARLLSRRLGLCRLPAARRGDRRREEHQRRQARRLPAQQRVQDHHGRHQVRQERRMDQIRSYAGPVSRRHGCREPGDLARHELSDRCRARRSENRQRDLSL